ncbi:MAG: hypothetical protein AMS14_00345 [Planctomycetes bacterium DG_20]|nr:MAG: hypothetical protein AMS14_00345 [Planctomycetes bacterium DG_20]
MKALLERDPKNVSVREGLVRLYLVDLDDPAEAAKYLEGAKDKALLKYVPAAAKGVEAPPELACLELGEWYRDLAATAPPHAREAMYARARAYLERFLEIHTAKDLSRTRATLALEKVQEAVAKLTAPPEKPTKTSKPTKATPGTIPPGTWVDLLPLVDPATDAVEGNWRRTGSAPALLSPTTDGRIMIPVSPRGSYEFEVRFVRTSGELVVGFILPVGYTGFVLALSHWRGQSHGLELINGNNASTNATTVKPGTLQNGREYLVRVSVVVGGDQVQIRVTLDGKPLIAWQGPPSALSVSANWRLPYRGCFGVGTNDSTAVFRSVRLKMLSGEARLLRPAGAGELATVPTGSTIRPGQWADLVRLIWLDRDRVRGEWEKTDSGLIKTTPEGHGRIMLPAAPDGSYELAFSFVREGGGGSVDAILPVGDHGVLYSLGGWKNTIHCLQQIDGRLGDSNPTCVRGMPLEQGRLYNALVRVERSGSQASVRGYLDGRVLTQWSGPATALSLRPEWSIPDRTRLGLMVNQLKATLPAIRLRMLSGEARVVAAAEAQRPGAADGPAATGPWVDLLPLVDPAKDTVHGKWEVQTGSLVGYPARLGRIAIPATTEGSYHLSVTFARTAGSGEVTFILPVGDSGVAFALGRRGGELLDAQTPPEGHALAELANGRFYELRATVLVQADQTEITFRLDGKHYLRWKGAPSALSVPRWCGLPHARGFGLGAWDSTVVFTSARLSMLSGKADRLR